MTYALITADDNAFDAVDGGATLVVAGAQVIGLADTADGAEELLGIKVQRGRALPGNPVPSAARGMAVDTDAQYSASKARPLPGVSLEAGVAELAIDPARVVANLLNAHIALADENAEAHAVAPPLLQYNCSASFRL